MPDRCGAQRRGPERRGPGVAARYSWAPAPTATHARSAFDTDSRLNFLAAAAMRVSAWAKGMGG
jgi:hypothetical protein